MRAYTVAAAAVTLRMSPKWLDNALTHQCRRRGDSATPGRNSPAYSRRHRDLEIAIRLKQAAAVPLARAL